MKYRIVSSFDSDQLTERVNESLKRGWLPLGGVQVVPIYHKNLGEERVQVYFSQSLTLLEDGR